MINNILILQTAIHQLKVLNEHLKNEMGSDKDKNKLITRKIARNNSLILDYQFRLLH